MIGIGSGVTERLAGAARRTAITIVGSGLIVLALAVVPRGRAPLVLVAMLGGAAAFAVARWAGPRWCAAALIVGTILAWYTVSTSAGRVNLRVTDVPYVALVGWVLVLRPRGKVGTDVGQRQLGVFLGALGVSLFPVLVLHHHAAFSPFVSWLRLVQTFSVVWLVPYVVRHRADRRFLLGVIALGCAAELARAIVEGALHSDLSIHSNLTSRLWGANGPDT